MNATLAATLTVSVTAVLGAAYLVSQVLEKAAQFTLP
jgi:hypothetical protein